MNCYEAVGVKCCNIDVATGERLSHEAVYGRIIEVLGGLDAVWKYVPYSLEKIRKAIVKDPHLNNLPMTNWDRASGFYCRGGNCKFIGGGIWELYRKAGINSASNATGVCILKEAARRMVEREAEHEES